MIEMVRLIKDELKLMADQIISISIHDSQVHHGDLEAVVFYRTESKSDSSEPTESLGFNIVVRDEDTPWDSINNEVLVNANNSGKNTLGIGLTFRNVGEEKIAGSF